MTNEEIDDIAAEVFGTMATNQERQFARDLLSRAIPEGHVVVPGWLPISTAPQNKACLIHYRNICNRDRVIKAQYVGARTIEANEDWPDEACDMDDETETAYIPAGWYEMIDNHDDCSLIGVSSSVKITGWMPLPAAPANKEG